MKHCPVSSGKNRPASSRGVCKPIFYEISVLCCLWFLFLAFYFVHRHTMPRPLPPAFVQLVQKHLASVPIKSLKASESTRRAAVFVPLCAAEDGTPSILFTERSSKVRGLDRSAAESSCRVLPESLIVSGHSQVAAGWHS